LVSLESVSVQPHIPVRETFQEFDEGWNDVVEFVLSHFLPDTFDQYLKGRLNPLVSNVKPWLKFLDVLDEDKAVVSLGLVFGNVLNEETIGIIPR